MLWRLYTIYDKKSRSTFGPIMAARTDDEARRHFTTVLADGQTMVGAYPRDFSLDYIGTIDDSGPKLTAEPCVSIMDGSEYIPTAPDPRQLNLIETNNTAGSVRHA